MNISRNDFQFLIECMLTDMLKILISYYHYSLEESMNMIYTSNTMKKLERPETGLYYQSTVYVMNFLLEELSLPPLYEMIPTRDIHALTDSRKCIT